MATWLKRGMDAQTKSDNNRAVRDTVEGILADIAKRGDDAVRELSVKFDSWDRESYRLTQPEIDACIDTLSKQDITDIEFAQAQVRNFAQHQKDSLRDLEV